MTGTLGVKTKPNFLSVFLGVCFVTVGLFYEFLGGIASVVLLFYLFLKLNKKGVLTFKINTVSIAVFSIVIFYILSVFWAADKGMAAFGILKFLPVFLFMIALMQGEEKEKVLSLIPLVAVFMTVISALGMHIPVIGKLFSVSGRISGFLEYSNTFAMFLLCAFILTLSKKNLKALDFVYLAVFVFGILYSGSRTVFVLLIVSVAVLLFTLSGKKLRLIILLLVAAAIFVVAVLSLFFDFSSTIGRFLTISFTESTFVGRFLYFYDALPIIFKNPFGTGYLGFYYLQQGIQTGVYSIRFVHNDFLQLLLDIGWLPSLLFAVAIIKSFFKKGTPSWQRLLIFVITAHCCFDFDLQFAAMFMMFVSLLDYNSGKKFEVKKKGLIPLAVTLLFSVVVLYFTIAQILFYSSATNLARKIYPKYTEASTVQMTKEDNIDTVCLIANQIIKDNKNVAFAYSAKGLYFYSKGNFGEMIKYMDIAIQKAPFQYKEYEQYSKMLINGIDLYTKSGDQKSAQICKEKLVFLAEKLHSLDKKLSPLGKKIKDQPTLIFSKETEEYIKGIK